MCDVPLQGGARGRSLVRMRRSLSRRLHHIAPHAAPAHVAVARGLQAFIAHGKRLFKQWYIEKQKEEAAKSHLFSCCSEPTDDDFDCRKVFLSEWSLFAVIGGLALVGGLSLLTHVLVTNELVELLFGSTEEWMMNWTTIVVLAIAVICVLGTLVCALGTGGIHE